MKCLSFWHFVRNVRAVALLVSATGFIVEILFVTTDDAEVPINGGEFSDGFHLNKPLP